MSIKGINWARWRPILATLGVAGMGTGGVGVARHFHDDTAGRIEGSRIEQTKEIKESIIKTVEPLDKRITALEVSVKEMSNQVIALTQHLKDEDQMRRSSAMIDGESAEVASFRPPG